MSKREGCHWACSERPTYRVEMNDGSSWLVCDQHVRVERRAVRPQRYGRVVPYEQAAETEDADPVE